MGSKARKRVAIKLDPYRRWIMVGEFLRLVYVSSRVLNAEAPLNLVLVGPPGDGKTNMLLRGGHLPFVRVLSDMSYYGVCGFMESAQQGFASTLVIPDLATLTGRRAETGKQTMAALAMLCAEGVEEIAVGKRVKDFGGVQASVISAVTVDDLVRDYTMFNQNAFLSRVFLVDFELSSEEVDAMLRRKARGDRTLLAPLRFPSVGKRSQLPRREVRISRKHADVALDWWRKLQARRPDRVFGFRTADALQTLLLASAYLRGARQVSERDVRYVQQFQVLWMRQFRMATHK